MIVHVRFNIFYVLQKTDLPGKLKMWDRKFRSTNDSGMLPLALWLCRGTWEAAILGFLETSVGGDAMNCIHAKPSC